MKDPYQSIEFTAVKQQIAAYCAFAPGAQALLEAEPVFDELWIRRELLRCTQAIAVLRVQLSFANDDVCDIAPWVKAAQKGQTLRPQELRALSGFIKTCRRVKRFLDACDAQYTELRELGGAMQDHRKLEQELDRCISAEAQVYDDASEALYALRRKRQQLGASISEEARRFIASHSEKLMDTITTMRGGRTCVLVKISEKNSIRGIVHGESASGQAAYLEPASLVELNNQLQSVADQETQEVERILQQLSRQVQASALMLLADLDTMILLDALFAKAKWCIARDGCVASLHSQKRYLLLKQARHPLIDPRQVVANTYELKEEQRCLIISGSNTGGKTVTLKTLALFVTMTHAGFPILCEQAILPFFHQICLDIGDQQSIQESLSTFSGHLSRLSIICRQADAHSFIVLDELGSGTDPNEGECLAVAILEELLQRQAMIVVSTHFAKVKKYAATRKEILLSCVAFDMETMAPTYRYLAGVSGQSNAFAIARRYQLPTEIVDEAQRLKTKWQEDSDALLEQMEQEQQALQQEKERLHATLDEVQELRLTLQERLQTLKQEQRKAMEEAWTKAQDHYETQLRQAEDIVRGLRAMKEDHKPHEVAKQLHDLRSLEPQPQPDSAAPVSDRPIAVGDYVQIRDLHYHGEVLSLQKNKACVWANGMKMNVKVADLEKIAKPKPARKEKSIRSSLHKSFPLECNVIGMRVEEALPVIDKYLDNAVLCKAQRVRIIHGMGTGALRKAVHSYLKRHAQVSAFQLGGQGEGGMGATVVELKQKGTK